MTQALIQNVLGTVLPNVDHAEGIWVYDTEGNAFLDGCSGAMAVNLGHSHPRVVEAMRVQAGRVTFTHRGAFSSEALVSLADKLASATGYAGVWFVDSGSEAIEAAMQFAIQFYRERGLSRSEFLSHAHSYHGNTLGASSLSGHSRRRGWGDLAHDFPLLPSPYRVRGDDRSDEAFVADLLAQAEKVIESRSGQLAGIFFEPVGGATLGAAVAPSDYFQGLAQLCVKYDVLLIADEVMTGLGRTGRMLAVEHHNVTPDLVALGKGLASGYAPIAATLVSERVLNALSTGSGRAPGGHTYSGNPFAVAVADAVFDVVFDEGLVARAARRGTYLETKLQQVADAHPIVVDSRGMGMLRALEFAVQGPADTPGAISGMVAREAMANGLIIYPATGGFNDACLIAPPLVSTEEEIDELISRLDRSLSAVEATLDHRQPNHRSAQPPRAG